jgi:hypothetical protein
LIPRHFLRKSEGFISHGYLAFSMPQLHGGAVALGLKKPVTFECHEAVAQ